MSYELRRFIFIVVLLLLVVGCNPAEKFSIVPAGMPSMNGLKSLHGKATVESTAGKDLMVESAFIVVKYKERELGTARVPAKERSAVRYDLALDGLSPANLQILQTRIFLNPSQITVDVKGFVKYGAMRKKVEIKEVPFTYIITNFDFAAARLR